MDGWVGWWLTGLWWVVSKDIREETWIFLDGTLPRGLFETCSKRTPGDKRNSRLERKDFPLSDWVEGSLWKEFQWNTFVLSHIFFKSSLSQDEHSHTNGGGTKMRRVKEVLSEVSFVRSSVPSSVCSFVRCDMQQIFKQASLKASSKQERERASEPGSKCQRSCQNDLEILNGTQLVWEHHSHSVGTLAFDFASGFAFQGNSFVNWIKANLFTANMLPKAWASNLTVRSTSNLKSTKIGY